MAFVVPIFPAATFPQGSAGFDIPFVFFLPVMSTAFPCGLCVPHWPLPSSVLLLSVLLWVLPCFVQILIGGSEESKKINVSAGKQALAKKKTKGQTKAHTRY